MAALTIKLKPLPAHIDALARQEAERIFHAN
jgi:hypothetical protein